MRKGARSGGFTLVEVLVVGGLISLALAMTAALVVTAMNSFARTARLGEAKQLGLAIYDYYENRLATATAIELDGEGEDEDWHTLAAAGGRIAADGEALYPHSLYGGFSVSVTAQAKGSALALTVTVWDSAGAAFIKESAILLVNVTLARDEDAVDDPVICYK